MPGFETYQWYGIFVPHRTPTEIVTRLNQELAEITTAPNITTILASQALAPAPERPEEFAAFFREQIAKWAAVLKPFTGPLSRRQRRRRTGRPRSAQLSWCIP